LFAVRTKVVPDLRHRNVARRCVADNLSPKAVFSKTSFGSPVALKDTGVVAHLATAEIPQRYDRYRGL